MTTKEKDAIIIQHVDHVFGDVVHNLKISRKSRNDLIDEVASLIIVLLNHSNKNHDMTINDSEIRKEIYNRMYVQKSL